MLVGMPCSLLKRLAFFVFFFVPLDLSLSLLLPPPPSSHLTLTSFLLVLAMSLERWLPTFLGLFGFRLLAGRTDGRTDLALNTSARTSHLSRLSPILGQRTPHGSTRG